MGGQPFYLRKFYEATEYLDEPFSEVTLQVIRLLLGDLQACDSYCQEDSRIEAKVQIGQEKYRVTVVFENGISMFCVTDSAGDDCTIWYLEALTHSPEEHDLSCFLSPEVYPVRLHQYKDPAPRYPGNLWDATGSIGSTRSFRDYLHQFIQRFQPQQLVPDKNYWLQLEPDGRFVVRLGICGEELPNLSETERWIYHYLCFLQLLRFWDGMQQLRNYKDVKLPVLIRDFSEHLDGSVDIRALYARTNGLPRQRLIIK